MSGLESVGQSMIRHLRSRRNARLRRPPRLRMLATARGVSTPTVYYLCPDLDVPTGGIRTIYRHVDGLNSIGIPAAVIHKRSGFACSWFDHQTNIVSPKKVMLTSADVLVVPEFYSPHLGNLPRGPSLVIFNQNAYRTFAGSESTADEKPYQSIDMITAMLVVSHDNAEYVRYAFPGLRVERIRNAVDSRVFYPATAPPANRIAVMPRRRAADCKQVLDLLAARGCLKNWEVVTIDSRSEMDTSAILRSSAIFLSFSDQEGFGMPPAEAMSCGCYVIGFTGLGGRDFFDPAICTPVEEGDILAFAKAVEHGLLAFSQDGHAMRQRALKASAKILAEYSPEAQRADLQAFFSSILLDHHRQANTAGAVSHPSGAV